MHSVSGFKQRSAFCSAFGRAETAVMMVWSTPCEPSKPSARLSIVATWFEMSSFWILLPRLPTTDFRFTVVFEIR